MRERAQGDLQEKAQGMPGARCTHSLVCKGRKHTSIRHRYTGSDPAFPAQWFYGLLRALPGDRAFLSPSPLRSSLLKDLTPASGRQDHTTSPSASNIIRLVTLPRPSHRAPNVRDDRETPLSWDGMAGDKPVIWVERKAKCFRERGLDVPNQIGLAEQIAVSTQTIFLPFTAPRQISVRSKGRSSNDQNEFAEFLTIAQVTNIAPPEAARKFPEQRVIAT